MRKSCPPHLYFFTVMFLKFLNRLYNMKRGLIFIVIFLLTLPLVYTVGVDSCGVLSSAGTYTLNTSLVSSTGVACINITSTGIIFDLAGFSISNSSKNGEAAIYIAPTAFATIVANGTINASYHGITIHNATNVIIRNITSINNTRSGFNIDGNGTNNTIDSSRASNITNSGFSIQAQDNNLSNNIAIGNREGFLLDHTIPFGGVNPLRNATANLLNGNNISNNAYGIFLNFSSFNNLSNNLIFNNSQSGIFIREISNNNSVFSNTIYNHTNGLASGIYLELINNITFLYSNSITNNTYGVSDNNANFTNVSYSNIKSNSIAVYFNTTNNSRVSENNLSENTQIGLHCYFCTNGAFKPNNNISHNGLYGILYQNTTFMEIEFSWISNNSYYGIYVTNNSDNNKFRTSNITENGFYGFYFVSGSLNNFSRNNISGNGQAGIYMDASKEGPVNNNRLFENNTVAYHTAGLAAGIYLSLINGTNHIYNNPLIANNTYGIYLNFTNNTNLTNNNITNRYTGTQTSGLYITTAYNSIFRSNLVRGFGDCVTLSGGGNNTLDLNVVFCFRYGFEVISNTQNNNFTGNLIANSTNGFFILADNNNYSGNLIHNNTDGFTIASNDNNVIVNNTIANNTRYGINLGSSANGHNVSYNMIYNNSLAGIYLTTTSADTNLSFNNTIHGHRGTNAAGIFLQQNLVDSIAFTNKIYDNPAIENNTYGIYINYSRFVNITNNVIRFNSLDGIFINNSMLVGVYYNTLINNSNSGLRLSNSSNATIINNTVTNNTIYGFLLDSNSYNITLYNNTFIGSAQQNGIYLSSITNTSIFNNTVYDASSYGIVLELASKHVNITNNTVINSATGILVNSSDRNNLEDNILVNNTVEGLLFVNVTDIIVNRSIFVNNTLAQIRAINSIVNISGVINISRTSNSSLDLNISFGSFLYNNSLINITTDYGSYMINNATNITVKALTLGASGATLNGCANSSDINCRIITNFSNVINVTNTSGLGTLDLTIINYNDSRRKTNINIGMYNFSFSGWSNLRRTGIDTTTKFVTLKSITNLGPLAVVSFGLTNVSASADGTFCDSSSEEAFTRLQWAIDNSSAGGTILSCYSTTPFNENVLLNKSMNIYGNQSGVLLNATNSSLPALNITDANGINITNLTIFGSSGSSSLGAVYLKSNNSNIYGLNISNSSYGIYTLNSQSNNIYNNTIYNNSEAGVFITTGSAEIKVYFNEIRNNTKGLASGVYINGVNNISNIYNNLLINSNTYGIYLNFSNYTNITNNVISSNTNDGVRIENSTFNNLTSNNISSNNLSENQQMGYH